MPQLRSGKIAEFNTDSKEKEDMSMKKVSLKGRKSLINKWNVENINTKDVPQNQEELVVSLGGLFENSNYLLDEESVKLIDSSLNETIEVSNINLVHSKKSLRKSIGSLKDSQDSSNEMKKRLSNKLQNSIIDSCVISSENDNSKEVLVEKLNNFRRSSRIKNKVSFVSGHTEIESHFFENENHLSISNNSTPKTNFINEEVEENNLTYSNEKVINLTYSGDKTSTDIIQFLRTPTSKKGTPYVKRLQRKSNNTSTPLNKSKIKRSLINSPVLNISTASKTSIKKVQITLPSSSSSNSNVFIFGSSKQTTNRVPFTPKANNSINIKTPGRSCTKMPDFASAHKKIFEKMESIEEYNQRKIERADALTKRDKVISRVKPSRNMFNQFGFRVCPQRPKLEQAKSLVLTKLPTEGNKSKNQQYIKGVRSNRRFDLLMKSRQNKLQ